MADVYRSGPGIKDLDLKPLVHPLYNLQHPHPPQYPVNYRTLLEAILIMMQSYTTKSTLNVRFAEFDFVCKTNTILSQATRKYRRKNKKRELT